MNEKTRIQRPDRASGPAFGRYRQLAELGRGAMGVVYRCVDPDFERTVAVKVLHPELLLGDSSGEFRLRFRNEMRAAGRVSHPNIVNVYDAGEQDGRPYFVMEFVEGRELTDLLREEGPLELPRVLALADEILAGLGHIHGLGVVHRDLKPANIFVTGDGHAKLADFGVAKLESTELTQMGTLIGSPRYMSPEQCQGLPADPRSDLFAVGAVLFEMVTGKRCFDGASTNQIMQQILRAPQEPVKARPPAFPDQLRPVLMKALAREPDRRYQTAGEFRQALAGLNPQATGATASSAIRYVAGGILAVAVLGAGVWVFRSSEGTPPTPVSARQAPAPVETGRAGSKTPSVPVAKPTVTPPPTAATEGGQDDRSSVKNLSLADRQKIKLLLQVAQAHELSGRLVTPSGSSAFDAFELVLNIDHHNADALAGLDRLQSRVEDRVDNLLGQGKKDDALAEAKAGIAAFPHSRKLLALEQKLK